jgi:hypothetical protein
VVGGAGGLDEPKALCMLDQGRPELYLQPNKRSSGKK